jgi:hypothetical protein
MQQIKYRLSKLVFKLVWIILKFTKTVYYLYIYYIFATIKLVSYIFYRLSSTIWISWSRKRRILQSPNRAQWTRCISGIYWLFGDCIYPNGNPVITPYKVTDKIRQPSAVKLVRRKFNILHRRRRVFIGY